MEKNKVTEIMVKQVYAFHKDFGVQEENSSAFITVTSWGNVLGYDVVIHRNGAEHIFNLSREELIMLNECVTKIEENHE